MTAKPSSMSSALMEPNVRLLRYFLAVADAGTFTAAAEVLHVSQPALSQQIKKLESELGFALFQRGTRHVTLTPRGKDLISTARQVVEAAQIYRNHARSLVGGTQKLTIGYRAPASASRLYARPGVTFIDVADAEPSVGALAWSEEAPDANPTVAAFIQSARKFVHHQRR